jgi:hypothetical protein
MQLTARIIWLALLLSVPIYGGLAFALSNTGGFKPLGGAIPPSGIYIFYLVGVGSAIGGIFLFKNGDKLFRKNSEGDKEPVKNILAPMVVSWALCETSAIMGLVNFFIFGALDAVWHLSAVAVVGMAICYPSVHLFEKKGGVF